MSKNAQIRGKQIKTNSISKDKLNFDIDLDNLFYENFEEVPANLGGVLEGSTFSGISVNSLLDILLYPIIPPTITLNSQTIREFGLNPKPIINLSGIIIEETETILEIRIKRGSIVIETIVSPVSPYTLNYNDPVRQGETITYNLEVVTTSKVHISSVVATFTAPTFYGSEALSANETTIKSLNKGLYLKSDRVINFNPTNQRYYYAYPASFGDLTKILDPNGFIITSEFTKRTETFTLADTTTLSYFVYEFKNDTTQTNFEITFKF